MKLSELDYDLPPERIAQWPLEERDASRMLLLDRASGVRKDRQFREFPELLRGDELVVVNNTRVFPARLWGQRKGIHAQPPGRNSRVRREFLGTPIEVLLLRSLKPDVWEALVRPGRKVPTGERLVFGDGELEVEVIGRAGYGLRTLRFLDADDLMRKLERLGHIPLPPYIKRPDTPLDHKRYQTVFARRVVAVAASTAGLHFTPAILSRLQERGIEVAEITLEVGLGTFEPVRAERIEDLRIHSEDYEISASAAEAIQRAMEQGRAILAVGTTVIRALEDAAEKSAARGDAAGPARIPAGRAEAGIFLYPGKPFRVVGQLLTNFHLPRSSLLALVAGFAGQKKVLAAYRHAVAAGYRFYSYGDCMWIR